MLVKAKGQAHIMEYVLLTFFILLILVLLMFFVTGWQITSTQFQAGETLDDEAMFLLRAFSGSPVLNRASFGEGSMLEDSKLTVLTCQDLESMFGEGWFAKVEVLDDSVECNEGNYPLCGSWKFCERPGDFRGLDVPVNVYRKTDGRVDIAILTVGVYV